MEAVKTPRGRVVREPVGSRHKLTVKGKEPGFEYRFVNDVDGRLQVFEAAGYEFVSAKDVQIGNGRVDSSSTEGSRAYVSSGGVRSYLMRIRTEYYVEDQKAKEVAIKARETAMLSPNIENKYGDIKLNKE
jgi:hypothetical protein